MKRILFTYILFAASLVSVHAQLTPSRQKVDQYGRDRSGNLVDPSTMPENLDSANVEVQSLPPKLFMWRISELLGNRTIIPADTAYHHFQNSNLTEGLTGHYNYLANMGSPRLSRIFSDRRTPRPTIFMEPFSSFFITPEEFNFTNSNVPYTNLTYHKAGNKINGEERFKSYFSVNVNKRLAFGFNFDYLYGRGYYNNQNTSYFNTALFASYIGDKYQVQGIYSNNYLKNNENGGISDDRYITNPEDISGGKREVESTNIPTVLNKSTNRNKDFYVYLNHRYNLGFKRNIPKAENDTTKEIKQEYVPVTSFIHTLKIERARRQFLSKDSIDGYYENTAFDKKHAAVNDSTSYFGVQNNFGIALLEGFNKYAKAGLTAFASHRYKEYTLMNLENKRPDIYKETELYVGGELSKKEGNTLHYHAIGEVGVVGKALGQFNIKGDIDLNFKLGKDTVSLIARGEISNQIAPFYMRHYHSKHFWWDDDMNKEFRSRIEGELKIAHWDSHLKVVVENIKNYTYFDQKATPKQYSKNIQVISGILNQNFKLGVLHLDNEVIWQKSSEKSVLPLPDLSLYHNLYLQFKLAKVLSIQVGSDVRYFTKYYAPAYMPTIQQFYIQPESNRIKIGGYPIVNVYANLHLKRTRFYVMMYHVNQGMGKPEYFLAPHYPINPRIIKFGVSWNFYD